MVLKLIAAMSKNRVIGKENQMPWHIPGELKLFKKVTLGHTILMGRKTFESINHPLPGRKNGVITRNKSFSAEGVFVFFSLEDALKAHAEETIFVIGGEEIYNQTIKRADEIYLTIIQKEIHGDRFFPKFDERDYEISERLHFEGNPAYEWIHFTRCSSNRKR